MTMLHITHTVDGKMTDTTTTLHHFDHHIQTMIGEIFTTGVKQLRVLISPHLPM